MEIHKEGFRDTGRTEMSRGKRNVTGYKEGRVNGIRKMLEKRERERNRYHGKWKH